MTRKPVTEVLALEGTIAEMIGALECYVAGIKEAHQKNDLATVMQGFGGISNVMRKAPRWQLVGVEAKEGDTPIFFGPDM